MRIKFSLLVVATIICLSCSKESKSLELTNPGFGITATSIDVREDGFDLPVLLNTEEVIKGLQFTLSWDPAIGQVIQPSMTDMNPGFTISSSDGDRGEMKVLVFSMTGDELNTMEPVILTIPVRISDVEAELFELTFEDVIFAGPNATSYEIPVTHAKLKINR